MVKDEENTNLRKKSSKIEVLVGVTILLSVVAGAKSLYSLAEETKIDSNGVPIVDESKYEIQTRNVLGRSTPDKFYEKDGSRIYIEIDGEPIKEYFHRHF